MTGALTKQRELDACVQSMASRPDLPAFSHQVNDLLSVVGDEDASLWRLTGLLLKNYSLTAKVLRTANSLFYNRAGRPILSISHAIAYLGWNTVRDLAAGMLLFEHFQKERNAPGLKELMLCSLLTANHAREVASRVRYPRVEEAYLCGMFRNLGEVLVAAYLPGKYAQLLRGIRMHRWSEAHACARVFGFGYEDLGKSILRYWNLPEKVGVTMAPLEGAVENLSEETDLLRAITDFSYLLSAAVYRGDPEESAARVQALLKKYGKALALSEQAIGEILRSAVTETKATFEASFMPLDRLRLDHQIETAMRAPAACADAIGDPDKTVAAAGGDLADAVADVRSVLDSGADFDLNDILYMILEGICREGRFDRALLCLVTPERTRVEARLGVGEGVDALIDSFRFPISLRGGPLAPVLIGRQDLFVNAGSDARYQSSGFLQLTEASYFGLLPVVVDHIVIGCLYFDRLEARVLPDEREKALLLQLRDSAARALERHRL